MEPTQELMKKSSKYMNSTPQSKLLIVERNFNCPVNQLFKAFTTPEALKIWWWPKGLFTDRVDMDFREGGMYFINMKGFDQGGGGMTGHFEQIVENQKIVMTDQFSDENGNAISAKEANMPGAWPDMIYITIDFSSVDDSTSRLKLCQQGIPNELQKECLQGWNESFDKLEKYLSEQRKSKLM